MLKCTAAWVSAETPLTVEMPVGGKHEKAIPPPRRRDVFIAKSRRLRDTVLRARSSCLFPLPA